MPEKRAPEQLLKTLWCLPVATEFQTTTGEQLRVEFPGWLNSGAGPDFLETYLCLGNQQLYSARFSYSHSAWAGAWALRRSRIPTDDPARGLYHNPQLPPLVREDGQMISIVKMATQLPKKWEQLVPDGAALLKEYDHLPGHCGSLLLEIG